MPKNTKRKQDPAMLGQTSYERAPLDHYPTPERVTQALLDHWYVGPMIHGRRVWEPACGDGAISKLLKTLAAFVHSTDIVAYAGFDPDKLGDFYEAKEMPILATGIVTNPPYGKDAERFVRHALKLTKPVDGFVAVLCRHEWDAAKGRADLFDHPAFAAKITLRFRPVWIKPKKGEKAGSPRFSYAWYVWDYAKTHPHPLSLYAA